MESQPQPRPAVSLPTRPPATMAELPAYLGAFTNYERQGPMSPWRRALGPERARFLLEELDLLPVAAPVIQVAGSKGKGSTVLWMEQLLLQRGARPGAFLSPHLHSINERTRVGGAVVDDDTILETLAEVHPSLQRIEAEHEALMPTFFDLWIAVAMSIFRRREVSHVLLEVGLGGPLDSTTAVPHSVGVLTTIDLEHRRELGDTHDAIAREKSGIARAGRPFIVTEPETSWGRVAMQRARENGAEPIPCDGDERVPRSLPAPQSGNLATALRVLEAGAGERPFAAEEVTIAIGAIELPARLEILPGPPPLLLDVSHTPRSLRLFCDRLKEFRAGGPATVLFGLLANKEWVGALEPLLRGEAGVSAGPLRWIIARPDSPRAIDPETIAEQLMARGARVTVIAEPHSAIESLRARARCGDAVAVTGSFYLSGTVRKLW